MNDQAKKEKMPGESKEWNIQARKRWNIMVLVFLVLVLCALFLNLRIFWSSEREAPLPDVSGSSKPLKIDSAKLENVLKIFDQKAVNSNEILNSKTTVADPSL